MTSHHCPNNPDLKGKRDKWVDGPVLGCPHHGDSGLKQLGFKLGRTDRRALDRQAGVVGTDRGGYVNG